MRTVEQLQQDVADARTQRDEYKNLLKAARAEAKRLKFQLDAVRSVLGTLNRVAAEGSGRG